MSPDTCPNCGADLPPKAKACPGCGADEDTGWSDQAHSDNLGLPDENFDYDDFVKRELSGQKSPKPRGIHWLWWLVAIGLVILFLLPFFRLL